jgi:hypothetical protein
MLSYATWIDAIKLQKAFGNVLTRDPSGTMEEQMRAEILSEGAIEAIRRGRNPSSESGMGANKRYSAYKKY